MNDFVALKFIDKKFLVLDTSDDTQEWCSIETVDAALQSGFKISLIGGIPGAIFKLLKLCTMGIFLDIDNETLVGVGLDKGEVILSAEDDTSNNIFISQYSVIHVYLEEFVNKLGEGCLPLKQRHGMQNMGLCIHLSDNLGLPEGASVFNKRTIHMLRWGKLRLDYTDVLSNRYYEDLVFKIKADSMIIQRGIIDDRMNVEYYSFLCEIFNDKDRSYFSSVFSNIETRCRRDKAFLIKIIEDVKKVHFKKNFNFDRAMMLNMFDLNMLVNNTNVKKVRSLNRLIESGLGNLVVDLVKNYPR